MSGQPAKYLRPKEVAAEFPFTEKLLEKLRSVGRGPTYSKRGHAVIYKRADVEKWIDAGIVRTRD